MTTKLEIDQRLLFDMVTFTFPIPLEDRMKVLEKANGKLFQTQYQCHPQRKTKRGRYKNDYLCKFVKGTKPKLSLYPIKKSHRFVWLEFNPTKLGTVGRIILRHMLIELLGRDAVLRLFFEAVLTRLDLTLDIYDMEPGLYIHRNRVQQSEIVRDSEAGEIESQIVGSKDSDIRIIMYDKDAEQGKSTADRNYQRIEVNYKHLNCSMDKLETSLADIFMSLNFYRNGFLSDIRMSKAFRNEAYNHGLNTALQQLSKADKDQYMEYLEDYRAHPINHKALKFDLAHYKALKFLVHKDFRTPEAKEQKSLINNTRPPVKHWMPSVGYINREFFKEYAAIRKAATKNPKEIGMY